MFWEVFVTNRTRNSYMLLKICIYGNKMLIKKPHFGNGKTSRFFRSD